MNKNHLLSLFALVGILTILASCAELLPDAPKEEDLLDGLVAGLNHEQTLQFHRGDVAFNDEIFTAETGLGPIFVATSCGSCHAGDGKGHPFTTLTRFGQRDSTGNLFLKQGGPQLQNRAIPGFLPEALPLIASAAKFTPPANTGLGFLRAGIGSGCLAMADPNDANGDGISGVVNWNEIPSTITPHPNAVTKGGKYICRFGKKAGAYNLLHQTVNAYNQDIGISSFFVPKDVYSGLDIDPEISTQSIHDVVFYLQTLKAPIRKGILDPTVIAGRNIFDQSTVPAAINHRCRPVFQPSKRFPTKPSILIPICWCMISVRHSTTNTLKAVPKPRNGEPHHFGGLGLSPNSQGGTILPDARWPGA